METTKPQMIPLRLKNNISSHIVFPAPSSTKVKPSCPPLRKKIYLPWGRTPRGMVMHQPGSNQNYICQLNLFLNRCRKFIILLIYLTGLHPTYYIFLSIFFTTFQFFTICMCSSIAVDSLATLSHWRYTSPLTKLLPLSKCINTFGRFSQFSSPKVKLNFIIVVRNCDLPND